MLQMVTMGLQAQNSDGGKRAQFVLSDPRMLQSAMNRRRDRKATCYNAVSLAIS